MRRSILTMCFLVMVFTVQTILVQAQSTEFTYHGKLTDAGAAANGQYDLQFRLFDAETGGTEVSGPPWAADNVQVTAGIFTVMIDFGQAYPLTGSRWLQIEVRPGESTGAYISLTPRQKITAAPYAVTAMLAQTANVANDSAAVGGFTPDQLVKEDDVRLADARPPLAGSPNYVQISPGTPQSGGFDVSGNGKIGNSLTVLGSAVLSSNLSVGGTITGNGSGLTNLSGANITSSTVSAAALAADVFPNQQNLKQLASLRWDLLGQRVAVGGGPHGVAFDGANIWVVNFASANVTKIRASDGAIQGTFAVGSSPFGAAFDGANIWVANGGPNSVTKLRASDGAIQGTFSVGSGPQGIAFDGVSIWVSNFLGNTVTKLRASDGVVQGTFLVGNAPHGIAFDGANIWVANNGSASVTKLRASDGAVLGTFAVGTSPFGVAFDGASIWVANNGSSNVTKLRASDGAVLGTFAVGASPFGVAFDGQNVWIADISSNFVTKLRAVDGSSQGTYSVGTSPYGLAFDGTNIWVTGSGSNNVTKLPVFP